MANCSISTSDLPSYVLDGLFYSSGEETLSDDDDAQNYDNVGELSSETDSDSESIFDRYSDTNDDKSYSMKQMEVQRTVVNVIYSL